MVAIILLLIFLFFVAILPSIFTDVLSADELMAIGVFQD